MISIKYFKKILYDCKSSVFWKDNCISKGRKYILQNNIICNLEEILSSRRILDEKLEN